MVCARLHHGLGVGGEQGVVVALDLNERFSTTKTFHLSKLLGIDFCISYRFFVYLVEGRSRGSEPEFVLVGRVLPRQDLFNKTKTSVVPLRNTKSPTW